MNNILDLFFSNDEYSISKIEIINNVVFLDHNLIKLYTDMNFLNDDNVDNDYPCSTSIPQYNLLEGSDSDWCRLNSFFNNLN